MSECLNLLHSLFMNGSKLYYKLSKREEEGVVEDIENIISLLSKITEVCGLNLSQSMELAHQLRENIHNKKAEKAMDSLDSLLSGIEEAIGFSWLGPREEEE